MRSSASTTLSRGAAFGSLAELGASLGATRRIDRVLIANNGLAAVKGIDSIRSWLYEHLGDPDAIQFVVMATPEDLKANAEHISMADQHVPVPGGPNSNNYANVDLIMHTALQNTCDAVYPGWGHASENPALPRECERSKRVTFLGPAEDAMFALGDKIASTIVAQSNGVSTVPWSGDSIRLPPGIFDVDAVTYDKAYVTTPEECEAVCRRIGFPVMIKASEGGGGKGIRRCTQPEDVKEMFFAVSEEVKGCHIFVMRMLENVRHLEVQLLADHYGNCIAVRTRDCSVQRRHQKVVEEGPAFGVDAATIREMELAAIRLAKAVNYCGLGTVEYMYDKATGKYFFLELNPRLQVEHPVSELISGVNLPAALLCVGMGIRLEFIPEVRSFYGEDPYGVTPINFDGLSSIPVKCHTIAVRVTAEDTDEGFRPTSGKVEEIAFKNSKECWGYFSVGSGGEIHSYSDSQFGHIFSSGETREEARRGMVRALRNLVIRGEIRTSSPYVMELLETPQFRDCDVSTAWLDGLIAQQAAEAPKQQSVHVALIAATIFRNLRSVQEDMDKYATFLTAGHVPSTDYLSNHHTESYVNGSEKYTVRAGRISTAEYAISLNGSVVVVPYRILKSGALHLTVGAKTLVAYIEKEPNSLRITIGGKVITLTGDVDPTKILASVPGRLVRYLIENGGHVHEGGTFAEMEVMKMILPLRATTAGRLFHRSNPGSTIAVGLLLAEVVPDDPAKVSRPQENLSPWPAELLVDRKFERPDGITRARRAVSTLWDMLQGYHFKDITMDERLRGAFDGLSSLFLSSVTLQAIQAPHLPENALSAKSPNEKLNAVFSAFIEQYLEVERMFDGCTRQEAIARLRETHDNLVDVFAWDFAHHQSCHHDVLKAILRYLEHNTVLLQSLHGTLSKLVELQSYDYGSLLLQVRYLLRQCSLPSFAERKAAFARDLEEGSLNNLIEGSYGHELLCAIIFDRKVSHLTQICLELFVHQEYFGECVVKDVNVFKQERCWFATYTSEPLEECNPLRMESPEGADAVTGRGLCMVFADEQTMRSSLKASLLDMVTSGFGDASIVTIFFALSSEASQEEVSALCYRALHDSRDVLSLHESIRTITFMVHGTPDGPHIFTFRAELGFNEDSIIRNVLPQSARRLELERLANFDVTMYPTPYKDVHLFKGTPKKKGASIHENRMFARVAVTPRDMDMSPWTEGTVVDAGHMLAKCLSALELARDDPAITYPLCNHVFVKLIELTFDVSSLRSLLIDAASSYQKRLTALGVNEVELAFPVKVATGLIPFRVVMRSPSGYGLSVNVYYETFESGVVRLNRADTSEDVSFATMNMSRDCLSDMRDSSSNSNGSPGRPLDAMSPLMVKTLSKLEALSELLPSKAGGNVSPPQQPFTESESPLKHSDVCGVPLEPYSMLSVEQVKRLQARAVGTMYVYDWPALLQSIVKKRWAKLLHARQLQSAAAPARPFRATELYLDANTQTLSSGKPAGHASCAMVVWLIEYAPPAYFDVDTRSCDRRQFVMVANDITFQSGSFAVPEDHVFSAACRLARREGIPFVYISSNSGARLGLCEETKRRFRVAFTSGNNIDYLYLTEEDYVELTRKHIQLEVYEKVVNGELRFVLTGIVGNPMNFIGVENLRGSALNAGEMSRNYSEIPTISLVSGRSVGIGAYLNRLGRRVIQTNDSPLILTGSGALNRLLGTNVYSDNSQLGGRQVMVPNGITHWCERNDYASAGALLQWLDFVPPVVHPMRCSPHRLTLPVADPIDRDVTFVPDAKVPYDPRCLVTGALEKTGLFDRGSWMETQEGWAKSVVAGRATLGGIPCGVLLVETRLTKKFNPADPADPTSSASFSAQAGQVWFPDSARKTADALDDFHRERLPCFIFANWRGFSGGMRDMYNEVLKFGASIVDNFRVYTAPVFIYIPPHGELRGGAWVVVDPVINQNGVVEMYCDASSRGGIIEAAGVAEIKFRDGDVRELIRRNVPELNSMEPKAAREKETALLPVYRDVSVRFADLHDTPVRMKATGVVQDVIPWKDSRRIFHVKLQRKLKELQVANSLLEAGHALNLADAVMRVQKRYLESRPDGAVDMNDASQLQWLTSLGEHDLVPTTEASKPHEIRMAELQRVLATFSTEDGSMTQCFEELFKDNEMAQHAMAALHYPTRIASFDMESDTN